ncbi:MAG: xanthine dehydrogenase accessory protein XdhC, partial [Vogesella sp.]|uniref:xanthine dehydrogenase accessory protein XdhC n=1 Tax=Vogesella sp. TaxID=1904252 RepID=UPI003F3235AA
DACDLARALLLSGGRTRLLRLSLAAQLGQCCGGVVWLLLERIAARDSAWLAALPALLAGQPVLRHCDADGSHWLPAAANPAPPQLVGDATGWYYREQPASHWPPLWLFGGGHVGEALVQVLQPTGWPLHWVDSRDNAPGFARAWAPQVRCLASDAPEDEVDTAPAGAFYLVMTHRHDLDLALASRILRRGDAAFFGMIGSRSKRASFSQRLAARGLDAAAMTCPIGVDGIRDKAPAAIAIAVAAQLLQQREAWRPSFSPLQSLQETV